MDINELIVSICNLGGKNVLTTWWANTALGMPVTSRLTGMLAADADGVLPSMEIFKMPRMIADVTLASEMDGNRIFSSGSWPTDHGGISIWDSNNETDGKADLYMIIAVVYLLSTTLAASREIRIDRPISGASRHNNGWVLTDLVGLIVMVMGNTARHLRPALPFNSHAGSVAAWQLSKRADILETLPE